MHLDHLVTPTRSDSLSSRLGSVIDFTDLLSYIILSSYSPLHCCCYHPPPETPIMSADVLVMWKFRIFTYQQRTRESVPPQQTTLFDLPPSHCDPDSIDPLTLGLMPISFYRMPANSPGDACLYFVIDSAAQLLLYVGETCRSNKRWKGIHDCKG